MKSKTMALGCVGLALAGLGAAPAWAQVRLNNPNGLVFDAAGALWVANYGANQVVSYDVTQSPPVQGTVITRDLSGPTRLAVAKGDLYVTNTTAGTVSVYKVATGGELAARKIGGLNRPLGVAVDASGNVYVAENSTDDVAVYSPGGSFRGSVGVDSTGATFQAPGALTIKGSSLFLGLGPSSSTDSVREYAVSSFLATPLNPSLVLTNAQGVSGPTGIAVYKTTLLVADLYPTDVTRYHLSNGASLSTISSNVVGPEGVAVAPNGWIYVANSHNDSISVYSASGSYLSSF